MKKKKNNPTKLIQMLEDDQTRKNKKKFAVKILVKITLPQNGIKN